MNKPTKITLYLNPEQTELLNEAAKREKLTPAQFMKALLEIYATFRREECHSK